MKQVVIGSRGSELALWQANHVRGLLEAAHPGLEVRVEVIKTTGDRMSRQALDARTETKGLFVKEIEEALLEGRVHLAVHSLKDLPTELPEELRLGCIPRRADARDALVAANGVEGWRELPEKARVATSSLRRKVQLLSLRPDLRVEPIRGNVDTRLRKLAEQDLDAIVLACAGLRRLELEERISYAFPVEEMVPAVGQGALAVETRWEDFETTELLDPLHDRDSAHCVNAERAFLQSMGGGCQVPMGGHARLEGDEARFDCFLANPMGEQVLRESIQGRRNEMPYLALRAAKSLIQRGAQAILDQFEEPGVGR